MKIWDPSTDSYDEYSGGGGGGSDGVDTHITDTTDAHDASAISTLDIGAIPASNVQTALEITFDYADSALNESTYAAGQIDTHTGTSVNAHDAGAITFTPGGTISATNVQTAIDEIAAEAGGGGLALGETSTTAYRGDRGKIAYDGVASLDTRVDTLEAMDVVADVTAIEDLLNLGETADTQTFSYTGSTQTFVVPAGVSTLSVSAKGAAGKTGANSSLSGGVGGSGAVLTGDLAVISGETLTIRVGQKPTTTSGGYNGGGAGGISGGGGGGATDIRRGAAALVDRLVVAAGGGGGGGGGSTGGSSGGVGGAGGSAVGVAGSAGGTNSAGGAGATVGAVGAGGSPGYGNGAPGAANVGGGGGSGNGAGGGGGGGGLYGGGGGSCTNFSSYSGAGGGGGSSLLPSGFTAVSNNTSDGEVVFTWTIDNEIATLHAADDALDVRIDAHLNDTIDAHDASAVSFVPTGTIAATTVQAAIVELDAVPELAAADPTELGLATVGGVTTATLLAPIARAADTIVTLVNQSRLKVVGDYFFPVNAALGFSVTTLNRLMYVPTWLRAGTIDRIGVDVNAAVASAVARLGIYTDNGSGQPGTLIAEATGTQDLNTLGWAPLTISAVLPATARYYVAVVSQGAAGNVRTVTSGDPLAPVTLGTGVPSSIATLSRISYHTSNVTGALPGTAGTIGYGNQVAPLVLLRYSS